MKRADVVVLIGGDEYDGGHNVGGGEKFGDGSSDADEFGSGVSGEKGGYGGNEKRCTENVGGSVDGEGDNDDGDTAAANVSSSVDDKVLLSNFKDWL
jgi:hypothetical protein